MAHMFEECKSLFSINLSNFCTKNVQNMDYMFANDEKLVYINLENMIDNSINSMINILNGTLDNMVFCVDNKTKFYEEIKKKKCQNVYCENDWLKRRLKIDADTFNCMKDCSEVQKYFLDYYCYEECPPQYISYEYVCELNKSVLNELNDNNDYDFNYINISNASNNTSNFFNYENDNSCKKTKNYFLQEKCKEKLITDDDKQKFIEATKIGLITKKLYDLSLMAVKLGEIFTIRTPNETYQIYSLTNKVRDENLTYIDLSQCALLLNKKYGLKNLDDIVVFKIEYLYPGYKIPIIDYLLFGRKGTLRFRMEFCKNIKINYFIPKKINNYEEYKYDPENIYYHDKCYPHSENNKDFILFDRRNEFNKNNMSLCESICTFKGYVNNEIICECDIKTTFNSFFNANSDKYNLIYRFDTKISQFSLNIWVMKCYNLILTKENLFSNKCSFLMLFILLINIIGAFVFNAYEYNKLIRKLQITILLTCEKLNDNNKKEGSIINFFNKENTNNKLKLKNNNKNKNIIKEPMNFSKELSSSSSSKAQIGRFSSKKLVSEDSNIFQNDIFGKIKNKELLKEKNEIRDFLIKTDTELNSLKYRDALILDKRTFCQYYISLIRTHQLLIFTFHTKNDYNSKVIKICYFFFIYALVFTINLFFVDDSTLYNIRITNGFDKIIIFNIEKIIYASVISYLLKVIISYLIFSERIFLDIKNKLYFRKKRIIGNLGMKYMSYFGLGIVILLLFVYYNMCFFAVFPNIQIFVLEISGISFALFMFIPFVINIFPAIVRIYSLKPKKDRQISYTLSQFLQLI